MSPLWIGLLAQDARTYNVRLYGLYWAKHQIKNILSSVPIALNRLLFTLLQPTLPQYKISIILKAILHNSKCRYGERGAADAKPKAQIILDAAKVSAASGGNSEPKQGQRSQSARCFCPRRTMRVPQPDIIEHFGNADAVPQPSERCLSRKAGIVRCCHKERTNEKYSGNSCTNDGERQPNNRQHKSTPCTKSTMLSGAGGVVVQFSRSAKTINLRS